MGGGDSSQRISDLRLSDIARRERKAIRSCLAVPGIASDPSRPVITYAGEVDPWIGGETNGLQPAAPVGEDAAPLGFDPQHLGFGFDILASGEPANSAPRRS